MAHWRDHLNSTLLGAYSLYDDATDKFKSVDGFIVKCLHEQHLLGASGRRDCFVAYTSLDSKKPMKINVTIANVLAVAAKSQNPDKWVNVPVTFLVDEKVSTKDGIVAALRVKARFLQAIDYTIPSSKLRACITIEELVSVWKEVGCTALESVKNEMKLKLTPKENELPKD